MRKAPVLRHVIDTRHPAKYTSVLNTIDGLDLKIGVKESIILLFHQYIFALLSFERIKKLSKFPLLIINAFVLFIFKGLYYNFPCGTAMKLFENFPSSCESFLILTWGLDNILSKSNTIFCFFTRVRVNVIFIEFIIKPKYSISWHGNNIDFDG